MIVDPNSIRITPDAPGTVLVSWTSSHPDWPAWIYIDSRYRLGPLLDDPTQPERSATLHWPSGETHAMEIQELPSLDLIPTPITIEPNTEPQISWNALAAAERYRLYHRDTPPGTDRLVFDGHVAPDEFGICRLECPITLDGRGGRWHFLRVEAVDAFGSESTRLSWTYWATQPDNAPKLTISAGSGPGLYNLQITE